MGLATLAIVGPLTAALLALLVRRHAGALALLGAATALVAAVATLARVEDGERFSATLPGLPDWPLRLHVDPLGAVFSTVVAVVSTCVFVYAVGYMADERPSARFFAAMSLFVAAMQTLVLAGDWILLLASWELIGLASYLLIGYWHDRPGVGPAATRAFLVTRSADLGLYLGVMILIAETGTSSMIGIAGPDGIASTLAGLALLVAAVGKSAQAPLQGWLMDAMAGPTPVSALLHAAALVVAGVILLTRAYPLLPGGMLLVVGLVAGVSAVVTGLIAIAQLDLKRLLAASTSSQLGLMILAIGAGSVPAAVFHLITHAAMKSSLFLAAGIFQHDRHTTDLAGLHGIGRERRATFAVFAVAGLALAGVPPLAGFWSKDAIIAATLDSSYAVVLAPLAVAASALTGVYIGRALRMLWGSEPPGAPANSSTPVGLMGGGLAVLGLLAATTGLLAEPYAHLLDAHLPESTAAMALGMTGAAAGLLVGWLASPQRLFGPALGVVQAGFRHEDGWMDAVVSPSLALARWCDGFDGRIHVFILGVGHAALDVATRTDRVDAAVHRGVLAVGDGSLDIARETDALDVDGIDGAIRGLVSATTRVGRRARLLQSGLVHRELLLTAGGTAAILILVLIV